MRPRCSVAECGKACNARGWCAMHYARFRKRDAIRAEIALAGSGVTP